MKELDFLPEWYKARKRRHSMVRKQYIGLVAVFLLMMAFNLTATHRAARVTAEVVRHEDQRMRAEAIVNEFNLVTRDLNGMKAKADLVHRIDTGVDIAAILAEISYIVDDSIVLSKIEFAAEPFSQPDNSSRTKGPTVQTSAKATNGQQKLPLGESKLQVILAGVAVLPADVADLVCRLEESAYFQQVRPSFYGKTNAQAGSSAGSPRRVETAGGNVPPMRDVTPFEITCYLANFKETEK